MKTQVAYSLVAVAIVGLVWACGSDSNEGGKSGVGGKGGATAGAGGGGGVTNVGTLGGGGNGTAGVPVSPTCNGYSLPCESAFDCCSGLCDAVSHTCASQINHCQADGQACGSPTDCCTLRCVGGVCGGTQCTSDGGACTANSDCCSQSCNAGACVPLNPACSTAGNSCSSNSTCCSKLCKDGHCAVGSSYCIQNGDICARPTDCCSNVCNIAKGASVGTCGEPVDVPANCDGVEGTVCSDCGGCCSRLCAPYGPTGVKICQPASGCRVVGELCLEDKDCCGGDPSSDLPGAGNGSCDRSDGGIVGRCRNVTSCSPQGNICHFKDYTCSISSAPNKCCAGVGNSGVCQLDTLGVPRCNGLGETCRATGEQCASADDCCDHVPCVRDSAGVLRCNAGVCVSSGGPCTINADCCTGTICIRPQGSTSGHCGVPVTTGAGGASGTAGAPGTAGSPGSAGSGPVGTGGAPLCAEYGQRCTTDGDCCGGTPCSQGICYVPIQ